MTIPCLIRYNKIKDKWLESFFSQSENKWLSVVKNIVAEDEWCAEAYLETDYSVLNKKSFELEVKKYMLFNELNK